jgi:hypothetical protein
MSDPLALIIKMLEENKTVLEGKFLKVKRLRLIADLLGPAFYPPVKKKGQSSAADENPKVKEFYAILQEFDRKFEFTGVTPERFTKIYTTYMKKLKEIQSELAAAPTRTEKAA